MSAERRWKGGPGILRVWLFELRLPANEHRILELLCEGADAEDGCTWPSIEYLAEWGGMSRRNVMRVVQALAKRKAIKVWRHNRRSSTYQVQCPELSRLKDLDRVRERRGVNLSPDTLSRDNLSASGDKSGTQESVSGDRSGETGATPCHPEEKQLPEELPTTNNEQEDRTDDRPGAASIPTEWAFVKETWNYTASFAGLNPIREITDSWKRMFRTRLHEKGFDWPAILARIRQTKGLDKRWADFEFFIKNDRNYAKLLDGKYDRDFRDAAPVSKTAKAISDLEDFKHGR